MLTPLERTRLRLCACVERLAASGEGLRSRCADAAKELASLTIDDLPPEVAGAVTVAREVGAEALSATGTRRDLACFASCIITAQIHAIEYSTVRLIIESQRPHQTTPGAVH